MGLFIGGVFNNLDDGNVMDRMSLFAVSYVSVNIVLISLMDGIHKRKSVFLRER